MNFIDTIKEKARNITVEEAYTKRNRNKKKNI